MTLSSLQPPVERQQYVQLFVSLLSVGVLLTAWLLTYQCSRSAKQRSLLKEVVLALLASLFVGTGLLFLLLFGRIWI